MIGYNVEKINVLMQTIVEKYKSIGEKMAEGWPTLSSTMEKEWVGPDEVSYETELAKNIVHLYVSCSATIADMNLVIKTLADNWINFQKGNKLNRTEADNISANIDMPVVTCYEIENIVKAGNPVFNAGTNMGLTNGVTSGTTIKSTFDGYIDGVYDSVKALYSSLEDAVNSAFLGSELNVKVNEYLNKIGTALAQLTTCHKSIYEALDKLIANYSTHESTQATGVSGLSTDSINFNGENLK